MEQMTDEEKNLLIEALLFSSCLEIVDSWSTEDTEKMFNLAFKLNNNATLKNLEYHKIQENSNVVLSILKPTFPDLKVIECQSTE